MTTKTNMKDPTPLFDLETEVVIAEGVALKHLRNRVVGKALKELVNEEAERGDN